MTGTQVEILGKRELRDAVPLLAREGWTFNEEDIERLDRLGGAMGARDDAGRLVGFLSFVDLDPVRWIGNVAVAPEARGNGLGARLVEATMAEPGRCPTTGLYSVEKAVTLYARLGFVPHGEAFAFRAEAAQAKGKSRGVEEMRDSDLPDVWRVDRSATGMDRRALIGELFAAYPESCRVLVETSHIVGYGIAKTYSDLTELGPLVAPNAQGAAALLDALVAQTPGPHEATALGANAHALAALEARGFHRAFRTVPMFRGPAPTWHPAKLAIAAGLEKS